MMSQIRWENKLLVVAGHTKDLADTVTVRSLDMETNCWTVIKTHGKAPIARGGQSVTRFGSSLIMFGGEDPRRRLLNDIHVLDVNTMTWEAVKTLGAPPAPRYDHVAALHAQRYLLIFGGGSHSTCFNDLHVLDLQTMEWSIPQTQGEVVSARAGHAGAVIGENWYIAGGGDNNKGASETLVLNMSRLVWSVLATVKERDPIASEGLSLTSATIHGEKLLVAFGGYNGMYNNEVLILKPKLKEASQPKIFQSPAAAAAAASVTAAYALNSGTSKILEPESIGNEVNLEAFLSGSSERQVAVETDSLLERKHTLESNLTAIKAENARLKENISEMNEMHAELYKELSSVQEQLETERSRCFELEVHIADLRKRMESMDSLHHEFQMLQQQKAGPQQVLNDKSSEPTQGQKSGRGVWHWISAAPATPNDNLRHYMG
ncbi:acyl-CoA-binding domain-containing protein 5 isoform X2 [Amborella trichopoda]|uniref:acyl-CoA-binding domain-containing protein 5 isoform X2 n=1 Tax=Amborella trichopoda TaxID=13333 RepID=UPI0009C19393|nr:acyl-CoA-binding domain-containing protein 5 isoform X2 [Amborella trichopoda]|eukprot:XP_020527213.1 acyl-CoA-binding domain-containing protein 5 isoform X2 [Amborella trichopoda]